MTKCRECVVGVGAGSKWCVDAQGIISEVFPSGGVRQAKIELKKSGHGIRSKAAIYGWAHKLGVRRNNPWTPEHERILNEVYPEFGAYAVVDAIKEAGLKEFDATSVWDRASARGLSSSWNGGKRPLENKFWDILEKHYPTGGSRAVREELKRLGLQQRSRSFIQNMASKRNLHADRAVYGNHGKWSRAKRAKFKAYYRLYLRRQITMQQLCKTFDRSMATLHWQAGKNGMTNWNDPRIPSDARTKQELANAIMRPEETVRKKIRAIRERGVDVRSAWKSFQDQDGKIQHRRVYWMR